ncbi:LysR family transcriptional regulator [Latilactobacillus curvatus]|uniref:LysR substrate-binding domain-containing protein n=1 Tax=Latilactobacillus curvatus TaxID=28038 RepID=UPI002204EC63|nr:LysR family transcriptional regulator [Latilactobacillus curvatus]
MKTRQENIFSSKTLTYFLQLAETMNYTQAAQLLGITQPALTQQIKKLERIVGAPLFYSVGKKLHISDAGRTMLDATHQIHDLLNTATDKIQSSTSATRGKINIGILASMEISVIQSFLIQYYKQFPDIEVSMHLLTRKEIWDRLENNKIDIAIMYLPDDSIKNWKPYKSRKIADERLLFISQDPALKTHKKIRFKDTLDNKWVTYPDEYYLNQFISEAYKNQLVDRPVSAAQFTSPFEIMRFAEATELSTALPKSFYEAHNLGLKGNAVQFDPAIQFELAFVFRKEKEDIPRIDSFFREFDHYLEEKDYLTRIREQNRRIV